MGVEMGRLTSIVAVNSEGAIGAGNALPWRVKSDLRFFRENTIGNVVIMGRRTYDSLGGPLPNRRNIVVTHGFAFFPGSQDCRAAGGIEEALVMADQWTTKRMETFVVGGASMYEQFAAYVDRYLITEIDKQVPDADTFFPASDIADKNLWDAKLIRSGRANGTTDEADYRIFEFMRRNPQGSTQRREAIVRAWQGRKSGNQLHSEFAGLRAVG